MMAEQWTLDAGRTIRTPDGEFYLSYGRDRHDNPKFRDFCKLDRIAHQVAALPDLLDALEDACLTYAVHGEQPPEKWLAALAKAKGDA